MNDIGNILQEAFMDGYRYRDAEIVRCKDCKHFILSDGFCTLHESCVSLDAFCSYGKGETNE